MIELNDVTRNLATLAEQRGTVALESLAKMLDALTERYKIALLTAKPEKVPALQSYAKQVMALRAALTDPAGTLVDLS